jgi:hypothetical protein
MTEEGDRILRIKDKAIGYSPSSEGDRQLIVTVGNKKYAIGQGSISPGDHVYVATCGGRKFAINPSKQVIPCDWTFFSGRNDYIWQLCGKDGYIYLTKRQTMTEDLSIVSTKKFDNEDLWNRFTGPGAYYFSANEDKCIIHHFIGYDPNPPYNALSEFAQLNVDFGVLGAWHQYGGGDAWPPYANDGEYVYSITTYVYEWINYYLPERYNIADGSWTGWRSCWPYGWTPLNMYDWVDIALADNLWYYFYESSQEALGVCSGTYHDFRSSGVALLEIWGGNSERLWLQYGDGSYRYFDIGSSTFSSAKTLDQVQF